MWYVYNVLGQLRDKMSQCPGTNTFGGEVECKFVPGHFKKNHLSHGILFTD